MCAVVSVKGTSLCIYVKGSPSPLICQSCLREVYLRKQEVVFFCFNLVSWMIAMWKEVCLSCCCLFCMPLIFSCNVFSVVMNLLCLRFVVSGGVVCVLLKGRWQSKGRGNRITDSRR